MLRVTPNSLRLEKYPARSCRDPPGSFHPWPCCHPKLFSHHQANDCAGTPLRLRHSQATYSRAWLGSSTVREEELSSRSGPGGRNTRACERPNSADLCASARRTVAVEATILGGGDSGVGASTARSPSRRDRRGSQGPLIRCSSSWITSSGGGNDRGIFKPAACGPGSRPHP